MLYLGINDLSSVVWGHSGDIVLCVCATRSSRTQELQVFRMFSLHLGSCLILQRCRLMILFQPGLHGWGGQTALGVSDWEISNPFLPACPHACRTCRMVMNFISDRFILFFPFHSDAVSWEGQSWLKKRQKKQNQFVLQNLKFTLILIISVTNIEYKLGCVGVENSACCTHQFYFICLSSSLCSFFFAENPLGNLCLHSAQYEEILSYCKGASRHDNRNGNKFHISGAEVLISKITALSNAAFNVCLQTWFQELGSVKFGYFTVGRERHRMGRENEEINFVVKCVKR